MEASAWSARGHALGELGRYEEELASTERAVSLRPRYLGAWVNRGYALLKLKRYREAQASFTRALEIFPGYAAAWTNKGITHCHVGEYAQALACFAEAERLRPAGMRRVRYWKALALAQCGHHREAVTLLEEVVRDNPRHAEAWVVLSNCHFLQGRLEESVRCFMVAYGIDRRDIQSCMVRGVGLLRDGKKDEALHCFSQAFGILLR